VVNLALPYQDLAIMDACLAAGVHYMDTANYEPKDEAKFEYHWQWAYQDRFKDAGLMALLGSGFDPGVTSVFTTWLKKHHFDRIDTLDILDCNGGDHGQAFCHQLQPRNQHPRSDCSRAPLGKWRLGRNPADDDEAEASTSRPSARRTCTSCTMRKSKA
jgi:hypothetical protein